jgi:hypothetical protein
MKDNQSSIIVLDKFIQATRDSGYKGTHSAVAELVDNSLQAKAKHVWIRIFDNHQDTSHPVQVAIMDDGCGMDGRTLRQALRFGGSSRFNDRSGLGRYGMGLPNSSLSQARSVEVYTWSRRDRILYSYLDIDEIISGKITDVPAPRVKVIPKIEGLKIRKSGTLVLWTKCDRLSNRRISTLSSKLSLSLGKIFRYYLWEGIEISINGTPVTALDPTFHNSNGYKGRASIFGQPLEYEIEAPSTNGFPKQVGKVRVTFTELPVDKWHSLPNEEKRKRGITNGAGVSVVRGNREVDYGWFFLEGKRRENYDDWWRCEINFDPILDEAFGITHTKQQIRPQEYLRDILNQDMENTARALNSRVVRCHQHVKIAEEVKDAEKTASIKENILKPLPKSNPRTENNTVFKNIAKEHKELTQKPKAGKDSRIEYRIIESRLKETDLYSYSIKNGRFILVINPEHPFYKSVLSTTTNKDSPEAKKLKMNLELLFLAAARAEAMLTSKVDGEVIKKYRKYWSDVAATYILK